MPSRLMMQQASPDRRDSWGVLRDLGQMEPETIIREQGLAEMLGCHPITIKRSVTRGELPPPVRMNGKPCWTARSIVEHIEERLRKAKREAEAEAERIARMHV
jgi:hypothetical protein